MKTRKLQSAFLAILFAASLALPVTIALSGCTTTQQTTTYVTLNSTELATTAAYDAYLDTAIKNNTPVAEVAKVSKVYNTFQAGMRIAITAARGNTSAETPPTVLTQATNVKLAIAASK